MKGHWILAIACVVSSYVGARHAVEQRLRAPREVPRVVAAQTRQLASDSIDKLAGRMARARQHIADSIGKRAGQMARARQQVRMSDLCQQDWNMARTAAERDDVLGGAGPLVSAANDNSYVRYGRCRYTNPGFVWEP